MKTLAESILKTTGIGARTALKNEKVYDNIIAWLQTCHLDDDYYYLKIDEKDIDVEPAGADSYKLTLKLHAHKLKVNGFPYKFTEIININKKPINIELHWCKIDDMTYIPSVVADTLTFAGVQLQSEITKLPKNCKNLIFNTASGLMGGKVFCTIEKCIKNIKLENLICKAHTALDWAPDNFKNITVNGMCILTAPDKLSLGSYLRNKDIYNSGDQARNVEKMLIEFIKNNFINTDLFYIIDDTHPFLFYKMHYDKKMETISYEEIEKDHKLHKILKDIIERV